MNTLDQDARAEVNMDDLIIFPHTIPLYCPIAEKIQSLNSLKTSKYFGKGLSVSKNLWEGKKKISIQFNVIF